MRLLTTSLWLELKRAYRCNNHENISDRELSLTTWFLSMSIWTNHLKPQFQRRHFNLQPFKLLFWLYLKYLKLISICGYVVNPSCFEYIVVQWMRIWGIIGNLYRQETKFVETRADTAVSSPCWENIDIHTLAVTTRTCQPLRRQGGC